MAIGNFHGNFDPEVYKQFVHYVGKGNVTRKLQEFMRTFNAQYSENLNDINIEILGVEINRLQNDKVKIDTQLQSKVTLMDQLKEKQAKEEQERLEKEKERIEAAKKCFNCGKIKQEDYPFYNLYKKNICKACYMSADKKQMDRWKNA